MGNDTFNIHQTTTVQSVTIQCMLPTCTVYTKRNINNMNLILKFLRTHTQEPIISKTGAYRSHVYVRW